MKRLFKISGIILLALILILSFLLLLPVLFKKQLGEAIQNTANKSLNTRLHFSELGVSFFSHFPHLTVNLKELSLLSSPPFEQDTLLQAGEISLGIDLLSLVGGPITITRLYIDQGKVNVRYHTDGRPNYLIYNSGESEPISAEESGSLSSGEKPPEKEAAVISIRNIRFSQTDFTYEDPSIPLKIEAIGINYQGMNELGGAIMRLNSRAIIDSIDVVYDGMAIIDSKPVTADLITEIDLNSLDMKFEKTDLKIKDVPFEFKGELTFRKDGYEFFLALFSMYEEEYLSGSFWMVSADSLWFSVKTDVNITLENWVKGFGIRDTDLRGRLGVKVNARGFYETGQNPASSTPDTIILRIPDFTVNVTLRDGYFRKRTLPEAISGISFDLTASVTGNNYRTLVIQADSIRASIRNNTLEGSVGLNGTDNWPVQARFATHLDLAELKEAIPFDSLDIAGLLDLTLEVDGNYAPEKGLFPKTTLDIALTDGMVKTPWYPEPIEQVRLNASVVNTTGTLSGTEVTIKPLSLLFEDNPFTFNGSFSHPGNLSYQITSTGSIDLAGIYRLFTPEGIDLTGLIRTNLNLKGKQQDALAGRVDRLHNAGTLILQDIAITTRYLPLPVVIHTGEFRFENDRVWFDRFEAGYGQSDITLNGYLSNIVNYVLSDNQLLSGWFDLQSDFLLVDELMSSGEPDEPTDPAEVVDTVTGDEEPPGVIILPDDLDLDLTASLKEVSFQGLTLQELHGKVMLEQGLLQLDSLQVSLIGCRIGIQAAYRSLSPERAWFDLSVQAREFDVKRAWNEVELFRTLASQAGKCEGIISLEYTLNGRLGAGMTPLYPSLQGGGTVTLEQVKVYGMKLFNNLGKNLEKEQIANPDLSKVELKTTIKNNVITLERTRMKLGAFRFRVEGETNFDGKLNLKTRLGLPPLGIIGIPIRVLGTQEDPKFKYGRGMKDEEVEETEYSDEIPPKIIEQLKGIEN